MKLIKSILYKIFGRWNCDRCGSHNTYTGIYKDYCKDCDFEMDKP